MKNAENALFKERLAPRSNFTLTICFSSLVFWSCAQSGEESPLNHLDGVGGKADISAGPIESISCNVEQSFIRRGGFARLSVDAKDGEGLKSRNYQLVPDPKVGTRVVQRDQVIFDVEGSYTVSCCALDNFLCDQIAIQVGEPHPALALSVSEFSEDVAILKGHALDRNGEPPHVEVNGLTIPVQNNGHFETRVATPTGLNRFNVVATDVEGLKSQRYAWTMGGPYSDITEVDPSAVRLRLGEQTYGTISSILKAYFVKLVTEFSSSDKLRVTQSGSVLGYHWEVTPTDIDLGDAAVTLSSGEASDELILSVSLLGFKVFADGKTRFRGGYWRHRDVQVSSDLYIKVPFTLHTLGVDIGEVTSQVQNLNVEISDLPGFIEGILEGIFDNKIQDALVEMVESVGDEGLSTILSSFTFAQTLELPDPLSGMIELSGQVSELRADEEGVALSIGLSADGETDPARLKAPGPLKTSVEPPQVQRGQAYELALHVDALNRILFSAWQSGGLDSIQRVDHPVGEDDPVLGDQILTLFITPALPPGMR